ncbi:hypothetical protein B1207_07710 [Legionella quinlivanii]|uniref:HTH cro/C1-type domain-containing protein n=1 Tax=Legionella quinlivanii TaxID=45073 RepID=A0A364LJJ4_9GAMM|nr:S24 family peptidase [Legionella quinlivanii]RAP36680.1 hypothetical protein B1207_07710 [Legionella quinlivanii]
MEIEQLNLDREQRDYIAQNLSQLMQLRKITDNKLAQDLGIPVMTVRRLLSGETTDPRVFTLKTIADYFQVTVDSLIGTSKISDYELSNSSKPVFVPLFDWEEAKTRQSYDLKSWKEWVPVPMDGTTQLSKNAFALESRPSMIPRFQQGTLFILDPDLTPTDGDLVLINLVENNDLTLKELFIDPPEWQLHPINHGHSVIHFSKDEHQIVAVVFVTLFYNRKMRSLG